MTDPIALPEPFDTFMLDVGDGHAIYVEQSGNPDGPPLITFHGGPGGQAKPKHRLRYDLAKFRLIMFDQRCSGQSRPLAVEDRKALDRFSPATIVGDAERIRRHLGLDSWHVTGVSWGSTMALLYAATYSAATRSLTLRALFMAQARNWAWMADGAKVLAPKAYAAATAYMPDLEGLELIRALADRILDGDRAAALVATDVLMAMEQALEILTPPPPAPDAAVPPPKTDAERLTSGLLYAHVIRHHLLPENWGTTSAVQAALAGKIFSIVHGSCDAGCPLQEVYALQAAHPHAQLYIAPNAGHGVDLGGDYDLFYRQALARVL